MKVLQNKVVACCKTRITTMNDVCDVQFEVIKWKNKMRGEEKLIETQGMSSLFHLQASLRVQYNYQETSSIWLEEKLVNIVHSVNSQRYLSLSFLVVYLFSSISLSCGIKYVCRNKMLQYSWMHAKREGKFRSRMH